MLPDKTIFNMNQSKHTSMRGFFLLSLLVLSSLLPSTACASAVKETSQVITAHHDQPNEVHAAESSPEHHLFRRQMPEGSECPDTEGLWNCMGSTWQRCASGRWITVMAMAAGTMCAPQGFSYTFSVNFDYSRSTSDAAPSAGISSTARDVTGCEILEMRPFMLTIGLVVLELWKGGYLG